MGISVNITVDPATAEKLKRLFREVPDYNLRHAIADTIANDSVIKRARYYPPEPGRPQPFKTAKQRRAFFAMLRDGRIKVPYPRTMRLQNNWRQMPDRFTVQNDTPYAMLVQGETKEQAGYHRTTGWFTTNRIAQESEEYDAERMTVGAFMQWVADNGLS